MWIKCPSCGKPRKSGGISDNSGSYTFDCIECGSPGYCELYGDTPWDDDEFPPEAVCEGGPLGGLAVCAAMTPEILVYVPGSLEENWDGEPETMGTYTLSEDGASYTWSERRA